MRVLIDTHLILWALYEQEKLPRRARGLLHDPDVEGWVSVVSIWEVAIKHGRGRLRVSGREMYDELLRGNVPVLPVTAEHAAAVDLLPPIHRDPFDRMLVAQARCEPMQLLTHDEPLAAYGDHVMLV